MSAIVHWNPLREMTAFQNTLDRFFDGYFYTAQIRTWSLALDATESEDNFIIKASAPGVNPDDLDITLEDDVLTIKGEHKADETIKGSDYRLRERRYGKFSRSIRFLTSINPDEVEAIYENGELTLVVSKAEVEKPRKIAVHVNGNEA